jgi:hypothetical protein
MVSMEVKYAIFVLYSEIVWIVVLFLFERGSWKLHEMCATSIW